MTVHRKGSWHPKFRMFRRTPNRSPGIQPGSQQYIFYSYLSSYVRPPSLHLSFAPTPLRLYGAMFHIEGLCLMQYDTVIFQDEISKYSNWKRVNTLTFSYGIWASRVQFTFVENRYDFTGSSGKVISTDLHTKIDDHFIDHLYSCLCRHKNITLHFPLPSPEKRFLSSDTPNTHA